MFIAGSPDALFQGVWDTTDFEKEADQTTNPRWDKPHAMNLFIGPVPPRSDDGPDLGRTSYMQRICSLGGSNLDRMMGRTSFSKSGVSQGPLDKVLLQFY